ncbi:MAG: hypothetical protein GY820_10130 [Gammaproteobacteria bacterium]|nr:hypothetical protein [Gammaproteobacteria bacterium]
MKKFNSKKNTTLKALLSTLSISGGILFCSAAHAAAVAHVTNGNDSGSGSLRDALNSGASKIVIDRNVKDILTTGGLYYDGTAPLSIIGSGQTIDGTTHEENILTISAGADLSIRSLSIDGGGGYSVNNQGGGKGIYVVVPIDQTGTVSLNLYDVSVSGVGRHGIHVSDCDLATCGAGGGGGGDGSPASINAKLQNVSVSDVGYGAFDSDGVRIDDRGDGDIVFSAVGSTFTDVGADGVELDEGDAGDVIIRVKNSTFTLNGGYCAPIDISGFPETEDETSDAPGHIPTADDSCVEWDATEYVLDLDDGFDIDEAGAGSLIGSVKNNEISSNLDEGLDFDEEGDDGIALAITRLNAINNGDEGVKLSEAGDGNIVAKLDAVTTTGNGDDGIQIEEEDDGDMTAAVKRTVAHSNKSGKYGLNVTQDGEGSGTLKVRKSDIDSISTNVTEL